MLIRKAIRTGTSAEASTYELVNRRALAQRIKSARQRAGMTQREMAETLSVSAGAVGQWETIGSPSIERLTVLARVLGVSVDWLLGKSGAASRPVATARDVDEDSQWIQARQIGAERNPVVADAREKQWLQENRGALDDANAFLEKHGLWSDGKRLF
jgi:transcriptional regulator with XRE-family HTH domain